jgi:hypothetical protein
LQLISIIVDQFFAFLRVAETGKQKLFSTLSKQIELKSCLLALVTTFVLRLIEILGFSFVHTRKYRFFKFLESEEMLP